MTQTDTAHAITELATPLATSLGLELWGVEVLLAAHSIVRIYVDAPGGVTIEKCAELSRLVGLGLEVEELIPGAYMLEVSSPGLERVFFTEEQLARAVGTGIELTLHRPDPAFSGRKKFWGKLIEHAGNQFFLQAEDITPQGEPLPVLSFSFASVKKARQRIAPPAAPARKPKTKKAEKDPHALEE